MKIKIAPSRIKELVIFCVIMAAVLVLYIWVRYSRFADWEYAVMPSFWYSCLCIVLLIAEVSYHKNLYITVESTETGFVAKRFNKTLCVVTDKKPVYYYFFGVRTYPPPDPYKASLPRDGTRSLKKEVTAERLIMLSHDHIPPAAGKERLLGYDAEKYIVLPWTEEVAKLLQPWLEREDWIYEGGEKPNNSEK